MIVLVSVCKLTHYVICLSAGFLREVIQTWRLWQRMFEWVNWRKDWNKNFIQLVFVLLKERQVRVCGCDLASSLLRRGRPTNFGCPRSWRRIMSGSVHKFGLIPRTSALFITLTTCLWIQWRSPGAGLMTFAFTHRIDEVMKKVQSY